MLFAICDCFALAGNSHLEQIFVACYDVPRFVLETDIFLNSTKPWEEQYDMFRCLG
jgi:hypothetical protein